MLNRSHPIPLYYQLKTRLEEMLKEYQVGDRLPPEQDLAEQFGVSRPTVRQALAELVAEGKVEKYRGLGSYVSQPKLDTKLTDIISFAQQLDKAGREYADRILTNEVCEADVEIASHLQAEVGTCIVHIERLRDLEGKPLMISQAFLLHRLCSAMLEADLVHHSLFVCVERDCGLVVAKVERYLDAIVAGPYHARLLEISPGAPVHYVQSYSYLEDGTLWGYVRDFFPSERNRFAFTVMRSSLNERTEISAMQVVTSPNLER